MKMPQVKSFFFLLLNENTREIENVQSHEDIIALKNIKLHSISILKEYPEVGNLLLFDKCLLHGSFILFLF